MGEASCAGLVAMEKMLVCILKSNEMPERFQTAGGPCLGVTGKLSHLKVVAATLHTSQALEVGAGDPLLPGRPIFQKSLEIEIFISLLIFFFTI